MRLSSIEETLKDYANGKMVIVVDNEDRENEGDLVISAECINESDINFMATNGKGLICMPIMEELSKKLQLHPMSYTNSSHHQTAFTVSVDYVIGTTTGISSSDRAKTIKAMIAPESRPEDFARPGHIFPLVAKNGGVLERDGHTEAGVELSKLVGHYPASVICEIINPDGTMSKGKDLEEFATKFNLKIISIKDLIKYIKKTKNLICFENKIKLPTKWGEFNVFSFSSNIFKDEHHLAFIHGEIDLMQNNEVIDVRIHSECLTGDVFKSFRCDCGDQLEDSLSYISKKGKGILLYMRQEGRGIGLLNKLKAYELQETGLDTVEANHQLGLQSDLRDYYFCAQVLKFFNINRIRLISNNPRKVDGLIENGIEIEGQVFLGSTYRPENKLYLDTKKNKLGHSIRDKSIMSDENNVIH